MAELRTRPPSGRTPWPIVLVDSEEKAGGTYTALSLATAAEVDRTFVVDFDGTADSYGDLGDFELVDHNGALEDVVDQIAGAAAEPAEDGLVNALVIDSVSTLWPAVVAWGDARSRNGKKHRRILNDDPDADLSIPENIWADVRARWRGFVDACRAFPGPVVWVARSTVDGQGRWSVVSEHSLIREATVWVRLHRTPRRAVLVGCELLTGPVDVPEDLPLDRTLPYALFDLLAPVEGYGPRGRTGPVPMAATGRTAAKRALVDEVARRLRLGSVDARDEAARLWDLSGLERFEVISPDQWTALCALVGSSPQDQPSDASDSNAAPPAAGPGATGGEVEPPTADPSPPAPTDTDDQEAAA